MDNRAEGSIKIFLRTFFVSQSRKSPKGILYCCSKVGYRKCLDKKRGVSRFSVEKFLSHSPENFRRGIVYCCIIFGDRKTLDKRGGVSGFSVENFSSHSAEKFRGGILYCCIDFGNRKGLDRKGRELQGIPSNIFCLTVPKNFVGQSFIVALISGIEKFWIGRGGGSIKIFHRESFVSQCQKDT